MIRPNGLFKSRPMSGGEECSPIGLTFTAFFSADESLTSGCRVISTSSRPITH